MERLDEADDEPDFATREEWAAAQDAGLIGGPLGPGVGGVDLDEEIDPR